jgi:hypothetical protein
MNLIWYCWGGDASAKTTMANIGSYQKAIPVSVLPQTFQDANIVARELNCKYLQIDALCIVQDDLSDWETEAAAMSQVYANSVLTISALQSSGSEDGFLKDREMSELEFGTYQTRDEEENRTLRVCVYLYSRGLLEQGTLSQHAWAYRERFLASANLHYTESGMVWECQSLCVKESGQLEPSSPILKAIQTTHLTEA